MNQVSLYLSRLYLGRLAGVAFAVLTLVSLLDSLGNSELLPTDAGLIDRLRFVVLRLPLIFDSTFAIIIFLSVLVTYLSLIRRNEIVALFGTGMSVFGQLRALGPCLFAVGALSALIVTLVNPPAARSLTDWLGPAALMEQAGDERAVWVSEVDQLVRIGNISENNVEDLTFFVLSPEGYVESVSKAANATYEAGAWALADTEVMHSLDGETTAPRLWTTRQTPDSLFKLQTYPRFLSIPDLLQLYDLRGSGSRPSSAYLVWLIDRFSMPIVALALLLLAVPLMQRAGRRETGEISAMIALAIGFVYLVADGIFTTLAESGAFSGWVGQLVPLCTLIFVGLWLTLRTEEAT